MGKKKEYKDKPDKYDKKYKKDDKKKYKKKSDKKYDKKKGKVKDKCCEKYIRKGKHCKDCPMRDQCDLPGQI